jgi:CO/xanthine dehydrogenase Mo-binding subunit
MGPLHKGLALDHAVELDSGDFAGLLDKTLVDIRWDELQAQVAARRANGELIGVGMGFFMEKGGLGPVDGAKVTVDTRGKVQVITGASSIGQGGFTALMNDGLTDSLVAEKDQVLTVKFYPDENKSAYGLTQGKIGLTRTFPFDNQNQAEVTISAENPTAEFAS